MKKLSCTCWSNGADATMTPVSPPMTNVAMKPQTKSIGVAKCGRPTHTVTIHRQEECRDGDDGHREQDHERRDQLRPDEDRKAPAPQRHAGCTLLEGGDDDLDGPDQRGDLGKRHGLRPDVDAMPRRVLRPG